MTMDAKARVIPFRRAPSGVEPLSDEALVAGCATGDANALAQLFERFCDDVARFLGRLAYVDRQDVGDLVQDVFLNVFRNASSYRGQSSIKTWMFAIASNLARDRRRKSVRGRNVQEVLLRDPPAVQSSAEGATIERDLVAKVRQGIAELPHDLRVAFVMCDVEELPGVDVARALGIPKGTLYRRVYEARLRLRRAIEGEGS